MNHSAVRIKSKLILGALLILAVSLWAYAGTISNQLVWDSVHYISMQEDHISDLSLENIHWMMTNLEADNWHPLTWLSWAIDYQIYGGVASWGYHLSNNIIHAINSVLVFILTLVIFALNYPRARPFPISTDNDSIIAATLTALLFAVHPQHVESVAWAAERKDLLCQLFMLLSILAYIRYVTCSKNLKARWYLGTLGLFSLALLSKPMAVTLPIVLLLIDIYPIRRTRLVQPIIDSIHRKSFSHLILEKIPFLALSMLVIVLTIIAQKVEFKAVPLDWRVLNAFNSIILYLEKLVVPLNFSPHYPYFLSPYERISANNFVPLIGALGISILAIMAWVKGHRAWLVAWCIFLVTLSPVLGLIQVGGQGAADRYAYFPTLPAYMLIGAGVLMALKKGTLKRFSVILVALSVIASLTFITMQQVKVWRDPVALWSQAVELFPAHAYAQKNLARSYMQVGQHELAAFHFEESAKLQPSDISTLAPRTLNYLHLSRYEDALQSLMNLVMSTEVDTDLKLNQFCIQYNIGWLYAHLHKFENAEELFSRVSPSSEFGTSAKTWLDWLSSVNGVENPLDDQRLPSFCESLIL